MQLKDRLPGTVDRKDRISSNKETCKVIQKELPKLQPEFKVKVLCLHLGAPIERPETSNTTLPSSSGKIYVSSKFANITLRDKNNCQNYSSRVSNTIESPYSINKNTQFAEFSLVTPEQSKFIKPVDTAFLSVITEGDRDLTTYLTNLLGTDKPEEQNNTF